MEIFQFELFKYKGVIYHSYIIDGTEQRVFFRYENGKRIIPSPALKRKLMKVHRELFEEKRKKKSKINFGRIAFYTIYYSLIASGAVLNSLPGDIVGRTLTIVPTSSSMEEFLENGLSKNENLIDEERKFFEAYAAYLSDNPYIEEKNIYYNLKNFQTYYDFDTEVLASGIAGTFSPDDNLISVYDAEMQAALEDPDTLGHEGFHMFSNNGDSCGFRKVGTLFGNGISEAMTEILKEEYIFKRANGITPNYKEETLVTKFIIEMIGIEPMLYGYAKGDAGIVVDSLTRIDNDAEKARDLIQLIDELKYADRKTEEYVAIKEAIYTILQSYYKTVDKDNESKRAVLTYYMESFYNLRNESSYILSYYLYKPYFSSALKREGLSYLFFEPASAWEYFSDYLPIDCNDISYVLDNEIILDGQPNVLIKEK